MELVAYRVGAAEGAVAGHWGQESLLANGVGEAQLVGMGSQVSCSSFEMKS